MGMGGKGAWLLEVSGLVAACAAQACGGSASSLVLDAGVEATVATDSGSSPDAVVEASTTESGAQSAHDSGSDSGYDSGVDSGSDSNSGSDASAWTPLALGQSQLVLWLASSAGITTSTCGTNVCLSQWMDQSGNGNNAVQTTTTSRPYVLADQVGGYPAVTFDGATQSLVIDDSASLQVSSAFTIVSVVSAVPSASQHSACVYSKQNQTSPYAGAALWIDPNYNGVDAVDQASTQVDYNQRVLTPTTTNVNDGQFHILVGRFDGAALTNNLSIRVDGAPVSTTTVIPPADLGAQGTPASVGGTTSAVQHLYGDLAEVMVLSTAISDADLASATGYLKAKYGL